MSPVVQSAALGRTMNLLRRHEAEQKRKDGARRERSRSACVVNGRFATRPSGITVQRDPISTRGEDLLALLVS